MLTHNLYVHVSIHEKPCFYATVELHQVMSFGHSACFEAQQHALRQILGSPERWFHWIFHGGMVF